MDSIAALIEAQEKGIFQSIENEYESSKKVVSAMEKRIAHQKSLVLDLNDRATQYSIMAREVDTNKEIYQSLLQRAKEIESMAGVSSSNIQIVNRADLPLVPSNRTSNSICCYPSSWASSAASAVPSWPSTLPIR
jgi:succinoglycan biosynthesis transport protein ExoP